MLRHWCVSALVAVVGVSEWGRSKGVGGDLFSGCRARSMF